MRPTPNLLELPYSFTQLAPLMPHEFVRAARERGVGLTERRLEQLHKLRLLVPILRVRRDTALIARVARSPDGAMLADQLAHWQPTSRRDLLEAKADGQVTDPATERFMSYASRTRALGEREYYASDYLYSPHQVLMLSSLRGPEPDAQRAARVREYAEEMRRVVVALTALEPVYYPRVIRSLSLPSREEFPKYDRWRDHLPLLAMRKWLGVDAGWIKDTAVSLLRWADDLDPLSGWVDLVRRADPVHWRRLKGDARIAIDHRIAAEVLLSYYDDLARGRRAKPLPEPRGRLRGDFDGRLKRSGNLDRLLTKYGLSPHPSLVLVVEGATEHTLIPRVMDMFGVRTDRDFIAVEDMEGVSRDLTSLVAFAAAPQTEVDADGRYLEPLRPLTRILVVTDAEGPMGTAKQRDDKRKQWVERLVRALPRDHRTPAAREGVDNLVYVDTWNRGGQSFEFAHFTDRQIAAAIFAVGAKGTPDLATLTARVKRFRSDRHNLDHLLDAKSKVALAEELWPVLERRIRRAERNGTDTKIPIVRIHDRAVRIAQEYPRGKVVIPLEDRPRRIKRSR